MRKEVRLYPFLIDRQKGEELIDRVTMEAKWGAAGVLISLQKHIFYGGARAEERR